MHVPDAHDPGVPIYDASQNYTRRFDLIQQIMQYAKEHNRIDINLMREGVCLEASGINEIISLAASAYDISNTKVKITNNCNLLESPSAFTDMFFPQSRLLKECQQAVSTEKNITNKFSSFIGRPSWDRLVLASWARQHKPSVVAFNSTLNDIRGLEFDLLCQQDIPNYDMSSVIDLLPQLPIKIQDTGNIEETTSKEVLDLSEFYKSVFLDIVSETACKGRVFFPTEKIFRPIMFKTPFVVFGSHHFLHNLRKLGFKTFNNFFSEWYDTEEDENTRITCIIETLDKMNCMTLNEMKEMYTEMQPILDHNYNVLMSLNVNDLTRERFNEE